MSPPTMRRWICVGGLAAIWLFLSTAPAAEVDPAIRTVRTETGFGLGLRHQSKPCHPGA